MTPIVVTGLGIVSAIGNNLKENLQALLTESSGLKNSQFLDSRFRETHLFGEVSLSNEDLKNELKVEGQAIERTSLLATKAFNEAVLNAQLSPSDLSTNRTAFISASTVGGMSNTKQLHQDANNLGDSDDFLETYNFSAHCLHIAEKHQMQGVINTINTACTSSLNSIIYGANLIQMGLADRAIVGGVDSLSKFTANGFNSMGILTEGHCKPFSEDRNGLNLGEGAAYLVLEKGRDKAHYACIAGYSNACDAFHASSISDEAIGVVQSIQGALKHAQLKPEQIDYINAHGTATPNNDQAEQVAYNKIFNSDVDFSSTKGLTGHTLGACGAVEAIFTILSLHQNIALGNFNFSKPMKEFSTQPVLRNTAKSMSHALTNSYGFNGNCSSLIFSKTANVH